MVELKAAKAIALAVTIVTRCAKQFACITPATKTRTDVATQALLFLDVATESSLVIDPDEAITIFVERGNVVDVV